MGVGAKVGREWRSQRNTLMPRRAAVLGRCGGDTSVQTNDIWSLTGKLWSRLF